MVFVEARFIAWIVETHQLGSCHFLSVPLVELRALIFNRALILLRNNLTIPTVEVCRKGQVWRQLTRGFHFISSSIILRVLHSELIKILFLIIGFAWMLLVVTDIRIKFPSLAHTLILLLGVPDLAELINHLPRHGSLCIFPGLCPIRLNQILTPNDPYLMLLSNSFPSSHGSLHYLLLQSKL